MMHKEVKYNLIVMQLLGKSLKELKDGMAGSKFSVHTSIAVGLQTLKALNDAHTLGFLHRRAILYIPLFLLKTLLRDVKPGNICVGRADTKEDGMVFLIDWNMSRRFKSSDGELVPVRQTTSLAGSYPSNRYASLSTHDKLDQVGKYIGIETNHTFVHPFTEPEGRSVRPLLHDV